jgi:hypothetical protein
VPENLNFQEPQKPEPKIRTMKSDIGEMFKDGKESLVSAVSKEVEGRRYEKAITTMAPLGGTKFFLFAMGGLLLLAGIGGGAYYYTSLPGPAEEKAPPLIVPLPYFSMEKSRNIILKAHSFLDFRQNLILVQNEKERDGIIKRITILVNDGETERLAQAEEFFLAADITPPKSLSENIGNSFNFFLYYQNGKVKEGVVLPILNEAQAFRAMIDNEQFYRDIWSGLYEPGDPRKTIAAFEDITDIRRLELSAADDIGFYYAIFKPKKLLVITTSYELMKVSLDRIFDSF